MAHSPGSRGGHHPLCNPFKGRPSIRCHRGRLPALLPRPLHIFHLKPGPVWSFPTILFISWFIIFLICLIKAYYQIHAHLLIFIFFFNPRRAQGTPTAHFIVFLSSSSSASSMHTTRFIYVSSSSSSS
jgi:hypothetical protein